jgi:hypothetical protein
MALTPREWTAEQRHEHDAYEADVKRMLAASNGRAPRNPDVIPGGTAVIRQCGYVEDHGGYGTKCFKPEGHGGLHEGYFVGPEDLQAALAGNTQQQTYSQITAPAPPEIWNYPQTAVARLGDEPPAYVSQALQNAMAPVVASVAAIAERFERFESNVHQLNLVSGELVRNGLTPLKQELAALRYNTGDKANSVVSMMESMLAHLDKQLTMAGKLLGQTPGQVSAYKREHGLEADVPSGQELTETGVKAIDESFVLSANRTLEAQTTTQALEIERLRRRIAELEGEEDDA